MGVRVLHDQAERQACLYCSTSDFAFGPVFMDDRKSGKDAVERIEAFLRWFDNGTAGGSDAYLFGRRDIRNLPERLIETVYLEWLGQEAAQYQCEEDAADLRAMEELEEERNSP